MSSLISHRNITQEQTIERGKDSAESRLFWQAIARKAAYQEIVSIVLVVLMFSIAGAAMLTGVFTWIKWILNEL